MKTKEIKAVLRLLDGTDVTEFEYEDEGLRIVVRRGAPAGPTVVAAPFAGLTSVAGMPAVTSAVPVVDAAPAHSGHVVTSPFVGTFYRAPAPDSAPFADVGQHVTKGQTLCIVEAMKLMNEIECEVDGKIVKILIDNGEPVEFGQPLFRLQPAK